MHAETTAIHSMKFAGTTENLKTGPVFHVQTSSNNF